VAPALFLHRGCGGAIGETPMRAPSRRRRNAHSDFPCAFRSSVSRRRSRSTCAMREFGPPQYRDAA
jgi:hypothetical protein